MSVAERQVRLDAGHVRIVHENGLRHVALLLRALAGKKVAAARFGALDFAGSCDLESFGHGLAGFATGDWLWHGKSPVEYQMAEAMQPETGGHFSGGWEQSGNGGLTTEDSEARSGEGNNWLIPGQTDAAKFLASPP